MLAIVVLSTALAEPDWINLKGGGCEIRGEPGHHLGATQFFYPGHFFEEDGDIMDHQNYQFGPEPDDGM